MEKSELLGKQPRRSFFASFAGLITGVAAGVWLPKKGLTQTEKPAPGNAPILYRRTEEAERYYRTLYR